MAPPDTSSQAGGPDTSTQHLEGRPSNKKKEERKVHFIKDPIIGLVLTSLILPDLLIDVGKTQDWLWLWDIGVKIQSILSFGTSSQEQALIFELLQIVLIIALVIYYLLLIPLSSRYKHEWYRFILIGFLLISCCTLSPWLLISAGWYLYVCFVFLFNMAWWIALLPLVVYILAWFIISMILDEKKWKYRDRLNKVMELVFYAGLIGFLLALLNFFLHRYDLLDVGEIERIVQLKEGTLSLILFCVLVYAFLLGTSYFFRDQIEGALTAGNNTGGVVISTLAIGTSIAVILVESNLGNNASYYPIEGVRQFITDYLHQANPCADTVVTLIIVIISILSLLYNMVEVEKDIKVLGITIFKTEPPEEPTLSNLRTVSLLSSLGFIVSFMPNILQAIHGHDHGHDHSNIDVGSKT